MSTTDRLQDQADTEVYARLTQLGADTEMISDTGTTENMVTNGLTLQQVAAGRFTDAQLEDAISWLDD